MNKIALLLAASPEVKRYKELEKAINNNEEIKKEFLFLKKAQQKAVQSNNYDEYNILVNNFKNGIFISEYLDLIMEINEDIKMIKEIIEDGLNVGKIL